MPKIVRGRCVKTIFNREILCAGTLNDYLEILERDLTANDDIDSLAADEEFTHYGNSWGYLEARKFTQWFDGVNINNDATHIFYMPFDQVLYEKGSNTIWIKKPGSRDRLFKVLKLQDYDEGEQWLALELKETGFDDKVAAEG